MQMSKGFWELCLITQSLFQFFSIILHYHHLNWKMPFWIIRILKYFKSSKHKILAMNKKKILNLDDLRNSFIVKLQLEQFWAKLRTISQLGLRTYTTHKFEENNHNFIFINYFINLYYKLIIEILFIIIIKVNWFSFCIILFLNRI